MRSARDSGGFVRSGPLDVYDDIQGGGPPLLLLHGGMVTLSMFDTLRPLLNAHWITIGIEQQGHGHVALGLAIRHPALMARIVLCGVNTHRDGLLPAPRARTGRDVRGMERGAVARDPLARHGHGR